MDQGGGRLVYSPVGQREYARIGHIAADGNFPRPVRWALVEEFG